MKPLNQLLGPYQGDRETPLGSYGFLVAVFNLLLLGYLFSERRNSKDALSPADSLLLGISTHKLARIITKDWVTSPFRALFTRFQENLGNGELDEESRGEGIQRAMGDLLTCQYCMGPWVALALLFGFSRQPRSARRVMNLFSAVAVSDFLHTFYELNRSRKNFWLVREEKAEEAKKNAA